jgi:hypothetical protein
MVDEWNKIMEHLWNDTDRGGEKKPKYSEINLVPVPLCREIPDGLAWNLTWTFVKWNISGTEFIEKNKHI